MVFDHRLQFRKKKEGMALKINTYLKKKKKRLKYVVFFIGPQHLFGWGVLVNDINIIRW